MATIGIHISENNIPYSYEDTVMEPGDKILVFHPGERDPVGEYIAVQSSTCSDCIFDKLYKCMGLAKCGSCCIISPEDTLEEL
jgi:hypothetical protein